MNYLPSAWGALALGLVACGGNVVAGTGSSSTGGSSGVSSSTSGSSSGGSTGSSSTSGGGSSATSTTSASSSSTSTTSSSGSTLEGDCTSDSDCPGGTCVPLTPGGWSVCATPQPEATTCAPLPGNQCCKSSDCTGSGNPSCYPTQVDCSPLPPNPGNVCIADECQSDADCTGGHSICTPANVFGVPKRLCLSAYCRTNADCTLKNGGICRLLDAECCSIPAGLACVYHGDCSPVTKCSGTSQQCVVNTATSESECVKIQGCPP